MRRVIPIVLSLVALAMAGAAGSAAAALRLDPGFGTKGLALVPGHGKPWGVGEEALAAGPEGELILGKGPTLRRLGPEGKLDRSFGEAGSVTPPPVAGGTFELAAVAVDAEGRIVVVGTSKPPQPDGEALTFLPPSPLGETREPAYTDARILRYLPSGQLDPGFGEGGIVETDLGLPTPEQEGTKLAAAPIVEATGVAVDGSGRIVVTGGAGSSFTTGGCFHDDAFPTLRYGAFIARLTGSGSLDPSFGRGGVFGAAVGLPSPLGMEDAVEPSIAPDDGVIYQRGRGHCSTLAGSYGFVRLTAAGTVGASRGVHALDGLVADAAAAPDGSAVLLLDQAKGSEGPQRIVRLRPNGALDRSFGRRGVVVPRLPHPVESGLFRIRVAASGEILVGGTDRPPRRKEEGGPDWWARFSPLLLGLTAQGEPDPRIGPHGVLVHHVHNYYELGDLFLDRRGRPTITVGYRAATGPVGFVAIRFGPLG